MFIYKITKLKIKNFSKSKAFTLLEIIIVIAITATIAAIGIGFYANQQKTKLLETATQEIVAYLKYAQQSSIVQKDGKQWGVHFENPSSGADFYALYTGTTYTTPFETKYLPAGLEFQTPSSGNSLNISFNKLTGLNAGSSEQELIVRLTSNQVARVIRATSNGLVTLTEGERGYWKFDEGSGTTALDSTIYKNNGTLINGPTWQSASNCVSGGCLSFDGVNDYIGISENPTLRHSNSITVMAWIKPMDIFAPRTIVSGNSYLFRIDQPSEGNKLSWFVYIDNAIEPRLQSTYVLNLNTWYHVAGVYNKDTGFMGIYINGILNSSQTRAGTPTLSWSTMFNIGARNNQSEFWNGLIDEVRIYNRALSPTEIQQHYNSRS